MFRNNWDCSSFTFHPTSYILTGTSWETQDFLFSDGTAFNPLNHPSPLTEIANSLYGGGRCVNGVKSSFSSQITNKEVKNGGRKWTLMFHVFSPFPSKFLECPLPKLFTPTSPHPLLQWLTLGEKIILDINQWRIHDFPERLSTLGAVTYYLAIFLPKTAWKRNNANQSVFCCTPILFTAPSGGCMADPQVPSGVCMSRGGYVQGMRVGICKPTQSWHLVVATITRTVGKREVRILPECFLVTKSAKVWNTKFNWPVSVEFRCPISTEIS